MEAPSPLRLRRVRLGRTIEQAAAAIGSNSSDVSRVERGRLPRPELERKLLAWYASLERRPRRATA